MDNEERIDRALEGLLPEGELERLQKDVIADPGLRALYAERAWLHGQLKAEAHTLPGLTRDAADIQGSETGPKVVWMRPFAWAAAAALVTAALILTLQQPSAAEAEDKVATLAEAEGCRWAGSDLPTVQGAKLGKGTLALVEGMATLEFESGARVTLEAPSTLEVLSRMRCRLVEGSLVADVPESAHGFTIDAPNLEVIDHGTRFGVTANKFGNSHVIVFEGEVEVGQPDRESRRLTTGESTHIGHKPPAENQEISHAPTPEPRAGWSAISTAFGRGKDAYVRRSDSHGPTGSHPLIMVKHTDLPKSSGNERRAFLTFDLSELAAGDVKEAQLVLDVEPSGLGFSAMVPDSVFEIYGIIDDELDSWDEHGILWNNAPATTDAGLIPEKVRKLGTFEIARGAGPSKMTVSSAELAEFIRMDRNSLVTFAVVRATGELDAQGLVHAFATKEHPDAQPPTLQLKLN